VTTSTYTCARCGHTYETEVTDEEAMAEAEANGFLDTGPIAVVCDDCYHEFMGWLTPEKKRQLDAEYQERPT